MRETDWHTDNCSRIMLFCRYARVCYQGLGQSVLPLPEGGDEAKEGFTQERKSELSLEEEWIGFR